MVLLKSFGFGALILNVCISLSPWMAASAPTTSGQVPSNTIAASGNPPISISPTWHSHALMKKQYLNVTSNATTPSTSSSPALETFGNSLNTSASPTSYALPSSATESSVATYGPRASNIHNSKFWKIVVPATTISTELEIFTALIFSKQIYHFFKLLASEPGSLELSEMMEIIKEAHEERLRGPRPRARSVWMARRILLEQGRHGGPLDTEQLDAIRELEGPTTIWADTEDPPVSDVCIGHPFCQDWPGLPPGSDPPPCPDPLVDSISPPGSVPPSDSNPPSDSIPPSDSNPPSDYIPPSDSNPPSDPKSDPPSDTDSPSDPPPPERQSDTEPPPPASEESIRLANELSPLPKEMRLPGRFTKLGPVRLVPEQYRTLPLDAKVVYATKYGADVWSQKLRYFKGAETAAVDAHNEPLINWKYDSNGDFISYQETTMKDIRRGDFPKRYPGKQFQKDLIDMDFEIDRLRDMEEVERERVAKEESQPPPEKPTPTATPTPEPTSEPTPEPTPTTTATPKPTPTSPKDNDDHDHYKWHDHRPGHGHRHKPHDRIRKPSHALKCIPPWKWRNCFQGKRT